MESKKFFSPPMCSCCMKMSDDFKPMLFKGESVYWFVFKELNKETMDNTQSIASMLEFASEGFEKSEQAPDEKEYQDHGKGGPMKIEFYVDTRKTFEYNFEKNLLCPVCADTFLKEKMDEAQGGQNPGGGDFPGAGFNPDGGNGNSPF